MKITASNIRTKSFEKIFRGYDKEEVTVFLEKVADEVEQLIEENKDLQRRLEYSEKEASKLKGVEDSLFRTLKTAEDTGASIIEEAKRAADEIMRDANRNSESILREAKTKSIALVENAEEKGKDILANLKSDIKKLTDSVQNLQQQRELLIRNLKRLSSNFEEVIAQSEKEFKKIDLADYDQTLDKLNKPDAAPSSKIQEIDFTKRKSESKQIQKEEPIEDVNQNEPEPLPEAVAIPERSEEQVLTVEEVKTPVEVTTAKEVATPKAPENIKAEEPQEKPKNMKVGGSFFDQID